MQKLKQDLNIGRTIRKLRQARNMTQQHVTLKMNLLGLSISRSTYAKIEVGCMNIKISELNALKIIFDVEYNDFFKDI